MKKVRQQIHRFKCPHGRVRFIRHTHGYFRFLHKDGSICRVLSQFASTLTKHFKPDVHRKPPKLHEVVTIFAEMPKPASELLWDVDEIIGKAHRRTSLSLYQYQKREHEEKERLKEASKEAEIPMETIERMARDLASEKRNNQRKRADELVRELEALSELPITRRKTPNRRRTRV